MEDGKRWKILKGITILSIVVGVLIVVLIITSFSYLDYYEVSELLLPNVSELLRGK